MNPNLDAFQLIALLRTVFGLGADERDCLILVDLPGGQRGDNPDWSDRRTIAGEWFRHLAAHSASLPFTAVRLGTYPNVGTNNGDLPDHLETLQTVFRDGRAASSAGSRLKGILQGSSVVLAMTELSATAPLKILARDLEFRGATLPGFSRPMMSSLGLDYEAINKRVLEIKERMDRATSAEIAFSTGEQRYRLRIDLRFRQGHASGGILREPGTVGNLPSGEAYIVPYEGDRPGIESATEGTLPVQFGEEVVLFRIRANRAVEVTSTGMQSDLQGRKLADEPAYGNIAELGIGVLGEWGVEGVGSTLLDEKLGLHIAFGRSDHFGGATSPAAFSKPENVIHIDWVYVPSVQRSVSAEEVVFHYDGGVQETVMRSGRLIV